MTMRKKRYVLANDYAYLPTFQMGHRRDTDIQGEFYTEGSDDLLQSRRQIARFSLSR